MDILTFGLIYLSCVSWAAGQGAQLTIVDCIDAPCEGTDFRVSFKLTGTLPPDVGRTVGLFKNGKGNVPICLIDRLDPCNSTTSCGCSESGGERTFHYNDSSATASALDGGWTAVLQASALENFVRSSVCMVQVSSCPYLVKDSCPTKLDKDDSFLISFAQGWPFPHTAGSMLMFMNDSTKLIEAKVNMSHCPVKSQPAGCYQNGNTTIFYLNLTYDRAKQGGDWVAYVDDVDGAIRSSICHVDAQYKKPGDLIAFAYIASLSFGIFGSLLLIFSLDGCSTDVKDCTVKKIVRIGCMVGIALIAFITFIVGLVLSLRHQVELQIIISLIGETGGYLVAGVVIGIVIRIKKFQRRKAEARNRGTRTLTGKGKNGRRIKDGQTRVNSYPLY